MKYNIFVDTGGTFTDCIGTGSDGQVLRRKVLSNGSLRALIEGHSADGYLMISEDWGLDRDIFRGFSYQILQADYLKGKILSFRPLEKILRIDPPVPAGTDLVGKSIVLYSGEEAPVLGARLITQTAIHESFPPVRMRLGSTKGTNALLEGKGAPTVMLLTAGFRDFIEIGTQQRPDIFAVNVEKKKSLARYIIEVEERADAGGGILKSPDLVKLEKDLDDLPGNMDYSFGVAMLNSVKNRNNEKLIADFLRKKGFADVSVSTELSSLIKYLPRAETTLVNACLSPIIREYIEKVSSVMGENNLQVMSSAGGLMGAGCFMPKDSLLSGPAGGVVGASLVARQSGYNKFISFDMGGTSTDVSRYDGRFEYRFELEIGEARIFSPSIAIETVAAGGGSVCFFDGYRLGVGPESAGAFPGPASYGAGGPLTITDVNLLLGRLDPSRFGIPVFPEEAEKAFSNLLGSIEKSTGTRPEREVVLRGFLDIANEIMAGAIRKISISKGYDPTEYALVAFGGAGGLHACAIASLLGMKTVIVPADAGLLSAGGLGHSVIERFEEKQLLMPLEEAEARLESFMEDLGRIALQKLFSEGLASGEIYVRQRMVYLRFIGQESTVELEYLPGISLENEFRPRYEEVYGYWPEDRVIEVESIRVIASTRPPEIPSSSIPDEQYIPVEYRRLISCTSEGKKSIPVYRREDLKAGSTVRGMALLLDPYSTTVLEEGWELQSDSAGTVFLKRQKETEEIKIRTGTGSTGAIELELFTNRFMGIAEDMGAMLQRTSLSVNVKERLDFSCALLDPEGYLVANAPHIPVHLGSLGICVRKVRESIAMEEGDTVMTNHPGWGGSHLPDITLITPVFDEEKKLSGYVVNRAHHAEIGGVQPASMPAGATSLEQEGVIIPPVYLVKKGVTRWKEIRSLLVQSTYPSRLPEENIADLHAALAANRAGSFALQKMLNKYGREKVLENMRMLRNHARDKMKETLMKMSPGKYEATEKLDDGTLLRAEVTIHKDKLLIDFTGSGGVHPGNLNANQAIVNSVVIYVLRLLIGEPIPLNDGILEPVKLVIPEGILNPPFSLDSSCCPAVVGGNVETSQRLTDTILKAMGVVACSQGTMNNLLFGNNRFSYYETICGGCGAGPGFNGASGVHHHMTNTRITDPEIMEHRYPVRLVCFSLRQGSGGHGTFSGGEGVYREIEFLERVHLSILSQHRKEAPYGLEGGNPGSCGRQWIVRREGEKETLEGMDEAEMYPGDRIIVETPGGGGFGPPVINAAEE